MSQASDPLKKVPTRSAWRLGVNSTSRVAEAQFDPPLLVIEGLVGRDRATQLLGVGLQGVQLVEDGNADELDVGEHAASRVDGPSTTTRPSLSEHRKCLYINR